MFSKMHIFPLLIINRYENKNYHYPLAMKHSYGKLSIYRGFMMIYLCKNADFPVRKAFLFTGYQSLTWHSDCFFAPEICPIYALYIVGFNSPTDLEIPSCSRLVAWWTQLDFKRTPKPCTERFRSEGTRDVGWLVGPVSPAFKRGCKKARKWRLIVDMSNFGYELV